jgi:hypothetical protein
MTPKEYRSYLAGKCKCAVCGQPVVCRWKLLLRAKFHFAYAFTSAVESLDPTVRISD